MRAPFLLLVFAASLALASATTLDPCLAACRAQRATCAPACEVQCNEDAQCLKTCDAGCDRAEQQCVVGCKTGVETLITQKAPRLPVLSETVYQQAFTDFVKQHGKSFSADEFFPRYVIFKANYNLIRKHNAEHKLGRHTYTLALNEFADMSFEEFHSKMTGYKTRSEKLAPLEHGTTTGPHQLLGAADIADSLDWRTRNAVTPVKNQGQCGSCWSFSTTGATEGAHAIKTGSLVSLSEQQLIDCNTMSLFHWFGNHGCKGGEFTEAFSWISSNGITTEDAYTYTAAEASCRSGLPTAATLSTYVSVESGSDTALLAAVNIGPVSVAIEANQPVFQFYSGGVFDNAACGTTHDHAVLVVGYGTDASTGADYYLVKNSWGAGWGEQGYIRMVRNKNMCGILTKPAYPVV